MEIFSNQFPKLASIFYVKIDSPECCKIQSTNFQNGIFHQIVVHFVEIYKISYHLFLQKANSFSPIYMKEYCHFKNENNFFLTYTPNNCEITYPIF